MINIFVLELIRGFFNIMKIKGTLQGLKRTLSLIYKHFKTKEEREEDKSYEDVEKSHSGFSKEP